jgi:hypothetical protein
VILEDEEVSGGRTNIRRLRAFPVYDEASAAWFELGVRDASHLQRIIDRIDFAFAERYIISSGRRELRPLWRG